jgi:5'-AMP-activated protein kinase, catalytic alpha subunit
MLNKYKFKRSLGEGSFAKVYLYQHIKTKKKYAVKKLDEKKLKSIKIGTSNFTASDLCKEELKNLKKLHHPNIIWLHEVIDDPDGTIYLVTDYYPNGSLEEVMSRINLRSTSQPSNIVFSKLAKRGLTNW